RSRPASADGFARPPFALHSSCRSLALIQPRLKVCYLHRLRRAARCLVSVRQNLYLTISQPVAPTQANELGERLFILTRRTQIFGKSSRKGGGPKKFEFKR